MTGSSIYRPPTAVQWASIPALGPWKGVLSALVNNAARFPFVVFADDDDTVTIYDRYPKARVHLLVLPRANISSISVLRREHLGLVRAMINSGKRAAEL